MRTRQSRPIRLARDSAFMINIGKAKKNLFVNVTKPHPKKNAIKKEPMHVKTPIPRNYITFSKKMTSLFKEKYPSLSHMSIMSKVYQSWKALRTKGDDSRDDSRDEPKVEKQETIKKNEVTFAIPPRLTSDDRAQAQIEYFQNVNKKPIVSKYTVRRMINPYLDHSDPNETPFRVTEEALQTILTGMERYLVNTFSKANKLTGHRNRKSLTNSDMSMLMDLVTPAPEKDLGNERVDDEFNESGSEYGSEVSSVSEDSDY